MASEYTTEPMDSLPSIAEAFGHSGEWQTLAEKNPDLADPHNIQPGMSLLIPDEWVSEMAQESTTSVATTGTTSSTKRRSQYRMKWTQLFIGIAIGAAAAFFTKRNNGGSSQ